jgi:MFS family permease
MMGFVNSFYQACLVFPIAGLGHAACWAPVTALVQKWVPDKKRGMILSFVTIGIGLAVPFWGTLIPFIVSVFDWRAGWAGMGLFGLAVAGLNLILVRNPAGQNNQGVSAKDRLKLVLSIYKSLIRDKQFWIIGTAYLLLGFNVLVPFTFLPVYSREALQFDYATSTRFVSLIAFFGIAGQLTLGPLSDRLGRVNIMMVCSTIMAIACLGMITSAAEWWLYAAASFYGLAYGAVWPVYAAAASDFFPSSQTGSVVGLWTVFLGLGSIVSPVLCGWTIDISGVYTWAFFLGILSGAFSTLILTAIRFTLRPSV